MPKSWYDKPMRIAALQCNYEDGKTLEVLDKWQEEGFNTEQLFHPTADRYSALFDEKKHAAILTAYCAKAKSLGIRIILYLNTHILRPSDEMMAGEWAQQAADGTYPKLYNNVYYAVCLNSSWREHFFSVVDTLAACDIDGVFLDGPAMIPDGCFCPRCRARYHRECGQEMPSGSVRSADRFDFYHRTQDDFFNEAYRRFKAVKPAGVFYMNLNAKHASGSFITFPDALAYNDIVGTEGGFMFYGRPKDAYLFSPGVSGRLLEAIAPEKPRVIFMAGDQKPWSWYHHTPAETTLCLTSLSANAASPWYGLHGSTRLLATPGGRAAREAVQFLKKNEKFYEGTESAARVAVFYSYATERFYRTSAGPSDFYGAGGDGGKKTSGNATDSFHGVCEALGRSGIPYDVVTDFRPERLSRYDCVYLPTCACLSESTVGKLREFAATGGTLAGLFDSSLYDEEGRMRKDFGLADVFGVAYGGRELDYGIHNYFSYAEDPVFQGVDIPFVPAPLFGLDVTPLPGARVAARFHGLRRGPYVDPTPPENPAVVFNRYGKGRSIYLAGTFGEMFSAYCLPEYRKVLANIAARYAANPVRLENSPGDVEVVVRKQRGRLLVHLVNHAGLFPRAFESILPQRNLKLRVRKASGREKVQALKAGRPCRVRKAGDGLEILLPTLHEHELIVVE